MPEWRVPEEIEPQPAEYGYDLNRALTSVVGISSTVPETAFSAETLGTERSGNGVVIREDGVVLTIGYLINEADQIWLTTHDGRLVPGHAIGFDAESGFGLVQALGRLDLPALPLGKAGDIPVGTRVVAAGAGGVEHSVAAYVAAKQEFAGYWEYLLEEAIFTVPAHPFWGGTALIGPKGRLVGIGSLQLQQAREDGSTAPLNMYVPVDLLKPVLDDMLALGKPNRPPRPWLGVYAAENDDQILIAGTAGRGPAARADLRRGDIVLAVGGMKVESLADFFRAIWAQGSAGVNVPITVKRDGRTLEIVVTSTDRRRQVKPQTLQ
jgi:S1-C subfamily serine protease